MSHTDFADLAAVRREGGLSGGEFTRVAVIWIDWYAYHIARFRALADHPMLEGEVVGIELVGGAGVHGDLVFRAAEREGLPITTLSPDRGWKEAGQTYLARKVWAKLNELRPDSVLIPGYYTLPAIAATLWAHVNRKTTILMSESTFQDHPRKRFKEKIKGSILRRLFPAAIAGGVRQVAYLKTLGFRDDQIARLYDVVDNDYYQRQADDCRCNDTAASHNLPENYFLYVGRLAPEKNLDGLIQAFAEYRRGGGSWSLVLVGDGPASGGLREQAAAMGVADSVNFAGLKSTRDIIPYYAFAGCFVLPSVREPWGLVVNEAMAAGLPLILSDHCGCIDDLLESERNGYIFDPANPGEITALLSKVARLSKDDRRRMGRHSREIISRYSPRLWAEEVVRIAGINTIASHSIA